jgi:hypothetical protein
MAVEKYRSVEEMNAAPVRVPQAEGFERFVRHCARYRALAPRTYPRGVMKFRSVDEAERARSEVARGNTGKMREGASTG